MARPLLALAAVLVVGVALLLAIELDSGDERSPVELSRAERDAAAPNGKEAEVVDRSPRAPDEREAVATAAVVGGVALAAPLETDGQDDGDTIELTVVRASDDAPVPFAIVRYLSERDLRRKHREQSLGEDAEVESTLARHGIAWRADGQGRVLVPGGRRAYVCAASPELWGWRLIDGAASAELALARDPTVRVRVVDARGAPVGGVGVAVWTGDLLLSLCAPVTTDGDGRAELSHVRPRISGAVSERSRVEVFDDGKGSHWLGVDLPLVEPLGVVLDPDRMPADEIELALPPTGSLEVRLVDGNGNAVDAAAWCYASATPERSESPPKLRLNVPSKPSKQTPNVLPVATPVDAFGAMGTRIALEHGVARLPRIAVGARWNLLAVFFDGRRAASVQADGPRAEGEHVVVELAVAPPPPAILATVVDEEGAPLGGTIVRARMRSGWSPRSSLDVETDDKGRLRWNASTRAVTAVTLSAVHDGLPLRADVPIESSDAEAERDLGRVVLRPVAPLVQGRAVDVDGAPIEGATVSSPMIRERSESWWPSLDVCEITKADGRFALYGESEFESLNLVARAIGFVDASEFHPLGADEVVLRMQPAGTVTGRLLLGGGVEPDALLMRLQSDARSSEAEVDDDGTFAFAPAPVGSYRVTVESGGSGEVLASVHNVIVDGREPFEEARLQPLDLRGRAFGHRVRATTPDGLAPSGLRAWIRAPGALHEPWRETEGIRFGIVAITTAEPMIDVALLAPRMGRVDLESFAGERDVVLPIGATVELAPRDAPALLPDDVQLVARLIRATPGEGRALVTYAKLDAAGMLRTTIEPGEVSLSLVLKRDFRTATLECEPRRFTVPPEGARIEIAIDADSLARALESMPRLSGR